MNETIKQFAILAQFSGWYYSSSILDRFAFDFENGTTIYHPSEKIYEKIDSNKISDLLNNFNKSSIIESIEYVKNNFNNLDLRNENYILFEKIVEICKFKLIENGYKNFRIGDRVSIYDGFLYGSIIFTHYFFVKLELIDDCKKLYYKLNDLIPINSFNHDTKTVAKVSFLDYLIDKTKQKFNVLSYTENDFLIYHCDLGFVTKNQVYNLPELFKYDVAITENDSIKLEEIKSNEYINIQKNNKNDKNDKYLIVNKTTKKVVFNDSNLKHPIKEIQESIILKTNFVN